MRANWKIRYLGGSQKANISGRLPKNWTQFADLRGGLAKKRKVVFLRGTDTPMHTMVGQFHKW